MDPGNYRGRRRGVPTHPYSDHLPPGRATARKEHTASASYDRESSPRFKGRTAKNHPVPPSGREYSVFSQALEMVDRFFPPVGQPLARMVYGKRAASSLFALSETLKRRALHMGEKTEAEAMLDAERLDEADEEPGGPASLSRSPEVRGRRASVSPRAIPVAARTVPAESRADTPNGFTPRTATGYLLPGSLRVPRRCATRAGRRRRGLCLAGRS